MSNEEIRNEETKVYEGDVVNTNGEIVPVEEPSFWSKTWNGACWFAKKTWKIALGIAIGLGAAYAMSDHGNNDGTTTDIPNDGYTLPETDNYDETIES